MTAADVASIITATAALVAACGSATAVVMAVKNGRKIDGNSERIDTNSNRIEEVHQATNGMKEQLVKVTGDAKFAEGVTQGEEHPRRHRNHHEKANK
jgi:hypothetical protein